VIDFNREIGVFMIFTHGFRGKVQTISDIARLEEMDVTQVRRLLRLTLLAPGLLETIVARAELTSINLEFVLRRSMPDNWHAQKVLLAA
jgi:hypothetical protein